ncbi:MAG: hypothetical protein RMA76_23275 [Deltaproteobacteria bacterium]|jgi:hypothetical protein
MAKSKKKKKGKDLPQQKRTDGGPDPLSRAIDLFAGGDYPAARAALGEKQADTSLSEADRKRAGDFIAATKPEKGALWTVLACVGFFVIAVVVGIARQP